MPFLSINRTIPLLIVGPILASIGVTSYLGYYNGRKAVDDLAQKINLQTTRAIEAYLQEFLGDPHELLEFNRGYIASTNTPIDSANILRPILASVVPNRSRGFAYGNQQGNYLGLFVAENERDLELWVRNDTTDGKARIYDIGEEQSDRLREELEYDPRVRPWYQSAVEAGKPVWSKVYVFAGTGILGMSAASPLYDDNNILQGVFVNDINLSDINEFLENLYISPRGEALIVERNGLIVGNSLGESPFIVDGDEQERMDVRQSPHPLLQEVGREIFEQVDAGTLSLEEETYFKVFANDTRQYIGVMPVRDGRGIEWLIIVAIPETDFASVILASVRSTLIVGGVIAILATVMGLSAAKWIINPIQSLNWAAKAIEEDRFEPATLTRVTQRQDEVGELARVFEGMGTVISASKASLKQQMSALEDQVARAKRQNSDRRRYSPATIRELLERSRQVRDRVEESGYNGRNLLSEQLEQVKYFSSFSEEKLQQLIALGTRQILEKDEILFREEEPGESFYLILQGSVKVYVEQLDRFLTDLSAGEFFGELSLLLGVPRTATVKAVEETMLFVIDRQNFQTFLQEYADVSQEIARKLCEHQEELEERKQLLKAAGILKDEESFNQNPLNWIRNHLSRSPISS